ncbi:hypothetical protein [Candidatus Binatus sp.]|uniref:hypothetical protein n=1 Tax=Candidatus Binatus sp. TaxID=2811406 RepID=UPI003BB13D15
MKLGTLAAAAILICSFTLAPNLVRADENDWYQGQQGQWQKHGSKWRWKSAHGDQWFQGKQGHWYQDKKGWHWYGNDGRDYSEGPHGWAWHR